MKYQTLEKLLNRYGFVQEIGSRFDLIINSNAGYIITFERNSKNYDIITKITIKFYNNRVFTFKREIKTLTHLKITFKDLEIKEKNIEV